MGRERITWKCISDERSRKLTFKQRTKGLESKMSDFCTKCGVEACLIVYEDDEDAQPMIWPEDPTKVRSLVEKYEIQNDVRPAKNFNLKDFFENRMNMVEAEISRKRKDILKIKYPTWDPIFKSLEEEDRMMFLARLDAKIGACNQRIDNLKSNSQVETSSSFGKNYMARLEGDAFVSNPSVQLNFMHNISQAQPIPTPMMTLNHAMGFQSQNLQLGPQMSHLDPNLMPLTGYISGVMDSTSQVEGLLDFTTQNNAIVDSTSQISDSMFHFNPNFMAKNNVMVHSTNQVEVPSDCTKLNVAIMNSTNQLGEPSDWANQYAEAETWVDESENWISQSCGLMGWTSQPSESVDWTSQLDHPNFQVIPSQSQNLQQSLPTLHHTSNGVLTNDYNNMVQVQPFNSMNQ